MNDFDAKEQMPGFKRQIYFSHGGLFRNQLVNPALPRNKTVVIKVKLKFPKI